MVLTGWNYGLVQIARMCVLLSLFFVSVSTTLNSAIVLAALLCVLSSWRAYIPMAFASFRAMNIVMCLFLLILAVSMMIGPQAVPFAQAWHQFYKYSYKFIIFLCIMPLFMEKRWRVLALATMVVAAIAVTILFAIWTHSGADLNRMLWQHPFYQVVNVIPLSVFVAFCLFLLMHAVSVYPRWRIVLSLAFLWLFYFLYYINIERTGMLVALLLIGLFCVQRFRFKGVWIACAVLSVVVGVLYYSSPILQTRLAAARTDLVTYQPESSVQTSSLGLRLTFARYSLRLIQQRPWFGYGVGAFPQAYDSVGGVRMEVDHPLGDPHNTYLLLWVEAGVVGLGLFLTWLVLQWCALYRLPVLERWLAQGMLLAFVVSSCLIAGLLVGRLAIVYFTVMGVLMAAGVTRYGRRN